MTTNLNKTLSASGLTIRTKLAFDGRDYISLTDIAKYHNSERPADVIKNWMRLRNTVEYLGLWEKVNNPDFKVVEFDHFKNQAGTNAFVLPPQAWIEATNAIGIQSKSGRYGGTYAHSDIAFKFASWLSPEFELYLIKDYQRLKQEEGHRLSLDWSARRELAKTNYKIHTDAVKENLILPHLTPQQIKQTYANEADIINMALFGMTAKDWRSAHPDAPKGENIRDAASIYQLIVLTNLETLNADMIEQGVPQGQRLQHLRNTAMKQLEQVLSSPSAQRLAARDDRSTGLLSENTESHQ